jgi:hypothetical protein
MSWPIQSAWVVYKMMDDGALDGIWTIADQESVGEEVLTPIK